MSFEPPPVHKDHCHIPPNQPQCFHGSDALLSCFPTGALPTNSTHSQARSGNANIQILQRFITAFRRFVNVFRFCRMQKIYAR
ncbi:hypothetical protein CCP2SC5_720015 [Azospirillaceae bacterium]